MIIPDNIGKYLSCLDCGGNLHQKNKEHFECVSCKRDYPFKNGILDCMDKFDGAKLFSNKKWNIFYKKWYKKGNFIEEYNSNLDRKNVNQIEKYAKINKDSIYLELGCGPFYNGNYFADKCKMVIGIDFSWTSLLIAKEILEKRGVKNYVLIWGDIFKMPLKDNSVDLVYGGGVIEHFKNTSGCIKEYSRIIKKNGVAINAVPYLNIGALTYRQIWGNIPDIFIIRELAEFVHMKILKGKHMCFGYELSFTKTKLKKLHKKFGFFKIIFVRLDSEVELSFLPAFIRPILRKLAKNCSCFWPMMFVIAKK